MPIETTVYRLTSPRMRGSMVFAIQCRLNHLGYLPKGPFDWVYGPGTAAAVAEFQKAHGALVVDGEFDKNFQLSARNLSGVALLSVAGINVYDIMRSDKLVLTTAAVKAIEARFA